MPWAYPALLTAPRGGDRRSLTCQSPSGTFHFPAQGLNYKLGALGKQVQFSMGHCNEDKPLVGQGYLGTQKM